MRNNKKAKKEIEISETQMNQNDSDLNITFCRFYVNTVNTLIHYTLILLHSASKRFGHLVFREYLFEDIPKFLVLGK